MFRFCLTTVRVNIPDEKMYLCNVRNIGRNPKSEVRASIFATYVLRTVLTGCSGIRPLSLNGKVNEVILNKHHLLSTADATDVPIA